MLAIVFWMLLAQGTGQDSSAITTVNTYTEQAACLADVERLKKVFYVTTLCLKGER